LNAAFAEALLSGSPIVPSHNSALTAIKGCECKYMQFIIDVQRLKKEFVFPDKKRKKEKKEWLILESRLY
jgi:hypothetical protein